MRIRIRILERIRRIRGSERAPAKEEEEEEEDCMDDRIVIEIERIIVLIKGSQIEPNEQRQLTFSPVVSADLLTAPVRCLGWSPFVSGGHHSFFSFSLSLYFLTLILIPLHGGDNSSRRRRRSFDSFNLEWSPTNSIGTSYASLCKFRTMKFAMILVQRALARLAQLKAHPAAATTATCSC